MSRPINGHLYSLEKGRLRDKIDGIWLYLEKGDRFWNIEQKGRRDFCAYDALRWHTIKHIGILKEDILCRLNP